MASPKVGVADDVMPVVSVAPGEGELVEEAGDAVVARRDTEAAGLALDESEFLPFWPSANGVYQEDSPSKRTSGDFPLDN